MSRVPPSGRLLPLCGRLLPLLLLDAGLTWTSRGEASPAARWAAAALKWALLDAAARVAGGEGQRAALRRLAALLVLLPAALEVGGRPPAGPPLGPALCSGLSCLFWEAAFGGAGAAPDAGRLLARLLGYFRADSGFLSAGVCCIVLAVACDTAAPLLQGEATDTLRAGRLHSGFYWAVATLAGFSAGSCVFTGLRSGFFKMTHAGLNRRLTVELFRTLLAQEVLFFQENPPGSLCSRLHSDVHRMGLTVALNANAMLRSSIKTVLMLAAMLYLSRPLTALACVEIPLMAALQRQQVGYQKEWKEQKLESLARLSQLAHQSLGGIRAVRSFGGQREEARRFRGELRRLRDIGERAGRRKAAFVLLRRLGGLATKTAMLLAARSLVSDGRLAAGTLLTFLLFRKPMSHNLKEMFVCCGDTLATLGIISKVFGHLDRTPKCRADGRLAPQALRGHVLFRDVTFGYPSAPPDKPALKDVSVALEAGKLTALVGPSGSGKTSCAGLLKRLYEPQRGHILLDGQPLRAYDNAYLHAKVAWVPQNPVLLRGSLLYNATYGLEARRAARAPEVAAKIGARRLLADSRGDVGEGGAHLSEGDKQSVALIRALLRRPAVLILDEATSQMDVRARRAVLEEAAACGSTVLMVTHDLESAERAHSVLFMEDGAVTEEGTHAQLMARRGRYWQFREELSRPRS